MPVGSDSSMTVRTGSDALMNDEMIRLSRKRGLLCRFVETMMSVRRQVQNEATRTAAFQAFSQVTIYVDMDLEHPSSVNP